MNKIITLIVFVASLAQINAVYSQTANANFTAGNLVVVRVNTNATNNAVPVFLDEYNAAGTLINTVSLPSETVGANRRFLVGGGATASSQGFSTLSPNGLYLALAGHDVAAGATQANTENNIQYVTTPKVVAIISNGATSPVINTSTAIANLDNRDNRNAVTSNGTDIWIGGQTQGIHYTTVGSTVSTQIAASPSALRPGGLGIFNGQLYSSTNANPFRIAKIGDGLPTSSATATVLEGIPATGANLPGEDVTNGFVLFDVNASVPGNDLLYFVSELTGTAGLGAGHIRKYIRTVESGDNWVFAGGVSVTNTNSIARVTANALVVGIKSLTGSLVGNVPTLYAASSNSIIKIIDNSATYNADLSATISSVVSASSGTGFRGLTFAPGTVTKTVLPVTLTSFNGKVEQNYVKLSWATSSEKNNSHFDVLRSADGDSFNVIGSVKGNNNSDATLNYSFKDTKPLNGTAYYHLNQVDFDGKTTPSNIIPVASRLAIANNFDVYAVAGTVTVKFNAAINSKGSMSIYNTLGETIAVENIVIQAGENKIKIPAKEIVDGKIYVALLDAAGNLQSKKFIVSSK
ncbi:hypothetical protein [Pedobacter helvus]|uniref:T9SS type A sorting domain-containing protein n=1 Tax=Pedobacter helvus TaxID=2563444 RepID=A0ABW9JMK6_9SPHI|nr:hypothetical protein [Pedobacter ureilyticus]